jgi:hypothetical protein
LKNKRHLLILAKLTDQAALSYPAIRPLSVPDLFFTATLCATIEEIKLITRENIVYPEQYPVCGAHFKKSGRAGINGYHQPVGIVHSFRFFAEGKRQECCNRDKCKPEADTCFPWR